MHELVEFLNQHDIVKAFGLSLLHSLWQGAIIAVLLRALLRISTQMSAGLRYCFALTALGSLLVCFAITLNTQLNSLNTAGRMAEETASFIIFSDEADAAAATETNLLQNLERSWNLLLYQTRQHVGYFFLAWTIGFLIFSFRFFTGLYYLRYLKQESSPLPKSWEKKVNGLKQKLGLHKRIILLASDRASTPLTFGWLRPVIIFPLSMISLLPDEQVESILLHELAHIRRNDYLVNLLQSIIEIIFFFNPAYWYLSKVLEQEREHICDDMVLAHSPNPHIYARALTRMAELSAYQNNRLAMNIVRREKSLLFRIKRIIQPSKSHIMERSIKRRSYQLASLIVACSLLVFLTIEVNGNNGQASLSQEEKNQPAATETVREISGVVLSKYGGTSLPGVAVTIKNSTTGTVTDIDGNYSLNAQPSDTLVFSFVGFHTKELAVNNQSYHAVVLESIEKAENSRRVVIEDIKVKENAEDPAPTTITKNQGNASEEGTRIFIIPDDENIKTFFRYIKDVDIQDIEHQGREINKAELNAIDPADIKSNLTISSEESGYKKAVTLIRLKGIEDTAAETQAKAKPQPLFIILEEDDLSSTKNPGNAEYIAAMSKGRQVQDLNNINSDQIGSIHVLKGSQALEVAGEAAKDGIMLITLTKNTADTTGKGTVTIKSTKEEDTAAKAVSISTKGNNELKGTDAQPLYLLLETGTLGENPGPDAYKAAIASGRQPDDPHAIDPYTIASMHVLKGSMTTSLGEAAKNGVVFITLKESETLSHELKGKAEDRFTVFPNPANEVIKISFLNNSKQHVTAEVLDPNGNKIHTFTDATLEKGSHEYEWNAGGQKAGMYTILLKRGKEVKTTKLILE